MWRVLAASAALLATAAPAQITSYTSSIEAPVTGDSNKIVCKKEEKLGTRLGAHKVCLTVREWQARQQDDRDQLEKGQSDTRGRRSG